MDFQKLEDFYRVYDQHRTYVRAEVRRKHLRNFDKQFWRPARASTGHSVLELGSGVGLFLAYLVAKGVTDFAGVEQDEMVIDYMPEDIARRVTIGDIWECLDGFERKFNRIVLFDVFEHFSYFEGCRLLTRLRGLLDPDDGLIVLRVPNAASPWGLQYQYNDLTHKAVYGPGSLQHLALAAGFEVVHRCSARRGSRPKRVLEDGLHWILDRILTEPPPLWSANMIMVLAPTDAGGGRRNP